MAVGATGWSMDFANNLNRISYGVASSCTVRGNGNTCMIFNVMGGKIGVVDAVTVSTGTGSFNGVGAGITVVVGADFQGSIAYLIYMAMGTYIAVNSS